MNNILLEIIVYRKIFIIIYRNWEFVWKTPILLFDRMTLINFDLEKNIRPFI